MEKGCNGKAVPKVTQEAPEPTGDGKATFIQEDRPWIGSNPWVEHGRQKLAHSAAHIQAYSAVQTQAHSVLGEPTEGEKLLYALQQWRDSRNSAEKAEKERDQLQRDLDAMTKDRDLWQDEHQDECPYFMELENVKRDLDAARELLKRCETGACRLSKFPNLLK